MPRHSNRIAVVLLALSLLCACGRPPAEGAANSADAQKLPFDRQSSSTGVSPSQVLVPSSTKLPEGTPIPIRLQSALSSASAHAGDTFNAIVDEPVVIDGQTIVAAGTPVIGRVLEAKPSASSPGHAPEPGYLRIVLVSLKADGRAVMIETSSIFAKGGSREERNLANASARDKDIVFGVGRHLNFRLAQTADLQ
jgi:hypothetical protein